MMRAEEPADSHGSWGKTAIRGWKGFTSPWRPSSSDLRNYLASLRPLRPRKILVLGGTPELRLLAASLGAEVTVIDVSPNMISEMGKYLPGREGFREDLIVGDWLKKRLGREIYDAVAADLALRLVPSGRQASFLRRICSCLKDGGRFVTRLHFRDTSLSGRAPGALFDEALSSARGRRKDPYYCASVLRGRLFDAGTWLRASRELRPLASAGPAFRREVARILFEKLRSPAAFFCGSKAELEKGLAAHFRIAGRRTAFDYDDAGFYPVYTLVKRRNFSGPERRAAAAKGRQ